MLKVSVMKRWQDFELQVRFQVPTPGVVALFGRSGCGKSTTVNLVAGLVPVDDGRIELDGQVLEDTDYGISIPAEQRGIGYVFQDSRLFPHFTVAGNLDYGLKRAGARNIATPIEFEPVVSLLGLGGLLHRRPHQLSGGERQRVSLGRALLSQPRLLLLDEPLASLDVARREEVLPYLEALRDALSIPMMYVSHQFEEVLRLATHIVVMDAGKVLAQGPVSEVSLMPEMRAVIGSDAIGAVLDGVIESTADSQGISGVRVGRGLLQVSLRGLVIGTRVRVQLLARDIILATEPPRGLSVRNALEGTVTEVTPDDQDARLVKVDIGAATVLSRVTGDAAAELRLRPGLTVWVLVKAVSTRGHAFPLV